MSKNQLHYVSHCSHRRGTDYTTHLAQEWTNIFWTGGELGYFEMTDGPFCSTKTVTKISTTLNTQEALALYTTSQDSSV